VIETDPKTTEYICVKGVKRKDEGFVEEGREMDLNEKMKK
jgi:hypothetical protein